MESAQKDVGRCRCYMSFTLRIDKRDFSGPLLTPGLEFDVRRYSMAAIGGPDYADVRAIGGLASQWQMFNWIRCPVTIYSATKEPIWWGYVASAIVRYGLLDLEVSIDPMFNSVAVMYNERDAGTTGVGTRGTTSYEEYAASVNEYGRKQILTSLPDSAEIAATEARSKLLKRWRLPIGSVNPEGDPKRGTAGAIELRGWWDTVRWLLYDRDEGRVQHEVSNADQAVGALNSNSKIKTTFKIPAGSEGWDAWTAAVLMSKEEGTVSELTAPTIELWSDVGGLPGSQLDTGTIPLADIPILPEFTYVTAQWTNHPPLVPDTIYHFIIDSHGPYLNDEYAVKVDEDTGYADGSFLMWNVSTGEWLPRDPDADICFHISGAEETTVQMEKIYDVAGQFFTAFQLAIDPSGTVQDSNIFTNQYRDGDTTAMEEILDLLAAGRENGNRYLAQVTKERILRIVEEKDPPALDEIDYWINDEGHLYKGSNMLTPGQLPIGFWMRTLHAAPEAIRNSAMINFDPMFVEWLEYDTQSRRVRVEARDKARALDVASILRAGR